MTNPSYYGEKINAHLAFQFISISLHFKVTFPVAVCLLYN